ncbi:MAG: succinyl-diaminopimelate desuccinylase [Myxococcales bacterium]|nr:succinyl-diaminopimelate desuccinylase [Myxococcales bacterium]MDD9970993.1 succinyl-diaminopimelate desuccinylase [Myxococcales bacterium]
MSTSSTLAAGLRDTLLEITRIDSPIGEERALCDHVQARLTKTLGDGAIERYADSLVVGAAERPGRPRVALVGHLDTVRTSHDGPVRIEGERLYGPGAADMKSGLAVMIELVERLDLARLPCDLLLVFYEREEGPFEENLLGPLLQRFDALRNLDLAICLEPSDNTLQLGCMGSLHATVTFEGRTAHSARPWQGDNAITKAWPYLKELSEHAPQEVVLDGHRFVEVMSATIAKSLGRGRNVIPDRFEVNVNYRFAPTRTPEEALGVLRERVNGRATVEPTDMSPAGRPHARDPLVQRLAASGVREVLTKQAWTDVARFDSVGVPAVNFGPGTQAQAHQRNEFTDLPLLAEGYAILERFLLGLAAVELPDAGDGG